MDQEDIMSQGSMSLHLQFNTALITAVIISQVLRDLIRKTLMVAVI